jgi:hypothetical protein
MAIWITRQSTAVPKAAAEEIEVLLDCSERLDEFISAARRQSVAVTPVEVIASISQELGVSNDILRKVFNSLENFKNLSEEFGGSDKMLDDLILNLNEKIAANLKERRTSIVRAVEDCFGCYRDCRTMA